LNVALVMDDGSVEAATASSSAPVDGVTAWAIAYPSDAPGAATTLRFSYSGSGKERLVYSIAPKAAFGAGVDSPWYPQLRGETRGVGTVTYHVPSEYRVVASGEETGTAAERAAGTYTFESRVPTSFSFGAGRYEASERPGRIALKAYALGNHRSLRPYLDGCARVLTVLEREFGPDPYKTFSVVEVPDDQAGAAGFSGASTEGIIYVTTSFLDAPFNTAFFGHEISHQWWGNLVRLRGDEGAYLLDEAMAQYGSLQVVSALDGPLAAEHYRRSGYPGYNELQNARGYFEAASAGLDVPLDRLHTSRGLLAHNLADSKGFLMLDLLSRLVGRATYRRILHDFTNAHGFSSVAWPDFLAAVASGSRIDVSDFASQWLHRTGAPTLRVAWTQHDRFFRATVKQYGNVYRVPITVRVVFTQPSATIERRVFLENANTNVAFETTARVRDVVIDPRYEVLHWTPEFAERGRTLADDTRGDYARFAGDAATARANYLAALEHPHLDRYGVRFRARYGLGRLALTAKDFPQARTWLTRAVQATPAVSTLLPSAYLGLAVAQQKLGETVSARQSAERALNADAKIGNTSGIEAAARAILSSSSQSR